MAESLFLTPDELRDLTQRARRDGQIELLEAQGIPHRVVAGRVIVARTHVLAWLEGRPVAKSREPQPPPRALNAGIRAHQGARRQAAAEAAAITAQADATWKAGAPARAVACARATNAKRRAARRNQTPPWADLDKIRNLYLEAARLTESTGVVHHVDHELPLRGRLVSGLHVHQNLRALPARDNLAKGNRFEPC